MPLHRLQWLFSCCSGGSQGVGGGSWWQHGPVFCGFWLLGLINNAAYVIMIAGANEIAPAAVGLVYFCSIAPTIAVKAAAPYTFHLVSYQVRFWAAAALMTASFVIVACAGSTGWQLAGVSLVALQGGLGEASALGLCSQYPSQLALTAWSSGTGFAGVFGYAHLALLHVALGLSFKATLLIATALPAIWMVVFHALLARRSPSAAGGPAGSVYSPVPCAADDASEVLVLAGSSCSMPGDASSHHPSPCASPSPLVELSKGSNAPAAAAAAAAAGAPPGAADSQEQAQQLCRQQHVPPSVARQRRSGAGSGEDDTAAGCASRDSLKQPGVDDADGDDGDDDDDGDDGDAACQGAATLFEGAAAADAPPPSPGACHPAHSMTAAQRARATLALWPYTVPLFVVYWAEYAMQSGAWVAIGFPVTSPEARHSFYLYSNWLYQAGVFLSRSSGLLFQATRPVLWAMPAMQVGLLVFFICIAITHAWWNWGLLVLCFGAGLLGGGVYVNAFGLLAREVEPQMVEFSLSAACVADSIGIAVADVTGVLLQGCLFRAQGLPSAAFTCGS